MDIEMIIDSRAFTLSKLFLASHVYLIRRLIKEVNRKNCWGCKHEQIHKVAHMLDGCEDRWTDIASKHYEEISKQIEHKEVECLVKTLMSVLHLPPPESKHTLTECYCADTVYSFAMLPESLWPNLDNLFCLIREKHILRISPELYTFHEHFNGNL